ncbi:hypothetical protein OSB04_005444 [Centaurea solstitialis]|uniref:Receptor-like serine/threonine-protein kinase n=1 Tax=Centaurea solstitialis TaxID=347529 RepID=A0AA38WRF7_9ASTR|nr:hypothetical protein OSB04_005444 [Centaurea solstitialis]
MSNKRIFLILLSCYFLSKFCYSKTDTLQQSQHFKDWDELVSSNGVFTLKFFSFGTSICPYLGIFYNHNHDGNHDEVVWVANRNNPIPDIYGKLMIDGNGKLSISSSAGTIVDLFSTTPLKRNASATLLNSGNLELQELWSLTSWRSEELPADGSFTLMEDHGTGTSQLVTLSLRRGNIIWRSGPWQNGQFENTNLQSSGSDVRLHYTSSETEQSFTYITKTYDSFPALRIYPDGHLRGSTLNFDVQCFSVDPPSLGCDEYEFEKLECRSGYYLISKEDRYFYTPHYGFIFVDEYVYDESYNLTLYDCKRICWRNCSCIAYTNATGNRAGCKTYGGMIQNLQESAKYRDTEYYVISYGQDSKRWRRRQNKKKLIWLMIMVGSLAPLLSCYLVDKKYHLRAILFVNKLVKARTTQKFLLHKLRRFYNNLRGDKKTNNELRYFTFQSILSATNKFSSTNKLGEGGFGAVYKGKLADGQEVAVKRLSKSSAQGVKEFKNEIELIVKLQHTNLVRLLGCCIEKQEKILVYEYMCNNSLDFFLFDSSKTGLLDWNNRFVIIEGIAQGLVYLHKFSRLRVIHRDLKASNILLDDYLKPKIADFGMAKLFRNNESQANTSRVVGTRGYMPPEYMREGTVSIKTDVFSFGVLLLEIVSGKKNHGSYDVEHPLNLLGLAWELWNEGRGLELMDPVLEDSYSPKEVMTCIHVGLLCVQDHATDRPTMSEVISMLTNEDMNLPDPKQPAFFIERHDGETTRDDNLGNGSVNGQSMSILVAR